MNNQQGIGRSGNDDKRSVYHLSDFRSFFLPIPLLVARRVSRIHAYLNSFSIASSTSSDME